MAALRELADLVAGGELGEADHAVGELGRQIGGEGELREGAERLLLLEAYVSRRRQRTRSTGDGGGGGRGHAAGEEAKAGSSGNDEVSVDGGICQWHTLRRRLGEESWVSHNTTAQKF